MDLSKPESRLRLQGEQRNAPLAPLGIPRRPVLRLLPSARRRRRRRRGGRGRKQRPPPLAVKPGAAAAPPTTPTKRRHLQPDPGQCWRFFLWLLYGRPRRLAARSDCMAWQAPQAMSSCCCGRHRRPAPHSNTAVLCNGIKRHSHAALWLCYMRRRRPVARSNWLLHAAPQQEKEEGQIFRRQIPRPLCSCGTKRASRRQWPCPWRWPLQQWRPEASGSGTLQLAK